MLGHHKDGRGGETMKNKEMEERMAAEDRRVATEERKVEIEEKKVTMEENLRIMEHEKNLMFMVIIPKSRESP
jgi:hypothetical protein